MRNDKMKRTLLLHFCTLTFNVKTKHYAVQYLLDFFTFTVQCSIYYAFRILYCFSSITF